MSVVPFVNMARLQPQETILNMGCGTAVVTLRARSILGVNCGAIVGIDSFHDMLQEAQRLWNAYDLSDDIALHFNDVTHLNAIPGFHNASQEQTAPTFDVIFARNILYCIPDN